MSDKKPFDMSTLTGPVVALFFIVGILIFLFVGDGSLTGFQTLHLESTGFWVVAVICILAALYLSSRVYKGNKNATMTSEKSIFLCIIILVLLAGPFGRGCTDKANEGYTAPGHIVNP